MPFFQSKCLSGLPKLFYGNAEPIWIVRRRKLVKFQEMDKQQIELEKVC